jgi:isopenicillin-N epimerase
MLSCDGTLMDPSRATTAPSASPWARYWTLDPAVHFLNHGSFGACPRAVLERQAELRLEIEQEPVRFLARELESRLDRARETLSAFVGAEPADLAFVPNATTAVNAVVRSLRFAPGDEVLITNHAYNACANACRFAAERAGAEVVRVEIPFPIVSAADVVSAVEAAISPRTRLALIEHVTSPTALVFPIEALVVLLAQRGVDTLVDGAHAPGMVPLDLNALGAAYYTGNCHKWLCAPKGAAFLHVRRDRQREIRPLTISHGANAPDDTRSRFHLEFDWTGTGDPTPYLCVPEAIRHVGSLVDGGWPAVMQKNHALALSARAELCHLLEIPLPSPDTMIGTMASVPLPSAAHGGAPRQALDPLQTALFDRYAIEIPIYPWPPGRILRLSSHVYNQPADYTALAGALRALLGR